MWIMVDQRSFTLVKMSFDPPRPSSGGTWTLWVLPLPGCRVGFGQVATRRRAAGRPGRGDGASDTTGSQAT